MTYNYIQEAAALQQLANRLCDYPDMTLAIDTETTGLDPLAAGARLLLCQIALPTGECYVVNAAKLKLGPLKPVFEDRRRLLLLQNAKFDYKWLKARAGIELARVYDTMLAESLLNAGSIPSIQDRRRAVSLKRLAMGYLGMEMDKQIRMDFVGYRGDEFSAELLHYAAEDVPLLFPIKAAQVKKLAAAGLLEVAKLEFGVSPAVGDMELNGLGVDTAQYRRVIEDSRVKMNAADAEIRDYLRKRQIHCNLFDEVTTNLNSHKQLMQVFKLLGNPVKSTEEEFLQTVNHPFARLLLNWRQFETQVSTFGEPVLAKVHPITGRIHPEFDQMGADSGRFSCKDPNLQQIPAEASFRSCFVPGVGNVMVVGDWSQFELRILCEFAQDKNMLEAFQAGRDMHSDTAARMYNLRYEDVDKHHPKRKDAKVLNFAMAYGMGPTSMAAKLGCTMEEAKAKIDLYFVAYPGVKPYLERAAKEGVKRMETRTASGRRRVFAAPDRADEEYRAKIAAIQRRAKNTPIQGTNGDALKRAMYEVRRQLKETGWAPGMVACVHDEIVLEVRAEHGEVACAMLKREMEAAGAYYLPNTPIKADVGVAACWEK